MIDLTVRSRIQENVAAARPKGWRCSIRVVDRELLVLTLQQAPVDPLAFLVQAAQAAGKPLTLVEDLRVAHARRQCRPVWVPSERELASLEPSIAAHLVPAGVGLARLRAALHAPVVDGSGRAARAGETFQSTFEIGSERKPFAVAAPRDPAPAVADLREWVHACLESPQGEPDEHDFPMQRG